MSIVEGPKHHLVAIDVYAGRSFKLQVPVRDGVKASGLPLGALVDLSSGTVKGVLRVETPDGDASIERDTSVSGEGAKVDSDGDGEVDAFEFYFAAEATADWLAGRIRDWQVTYVDTAQDPDDQPLVAYGTLSVKTQPAS